MPDGPRLPMPQFLRIDDAFTLVATSMRMKEEAGSVRRSVNMRHDKIEGDAADGSAQHSHVVN
jgi:hypothetical protein